MEDVYYNVKIWARATDLYKTEHAGELLYLQPKNVQRQFPRSSRDRSQKLLYPSGRRGPSV